MNSRGSAAAPLWALLLALAVTLVSWFVAAIILGIGCENRDDERICQGSPVFTATLVTASVELLLLAAWSASRVSGAKTWFLAGAATSMLISLGGVAVVLLWRLENL